jgi:Ca2+-binding RTX toxin-like protein
VLRGDVGNDVLFGGDNDDLLYGDAADDYLYGNSGNDNLYGGSGLDHLSGQAGDDYLDGGYDGYRDVLWGDDYFGPHGGRDRFAWYGHWELRNGIWWLVTDETDNVVDFENGIDSMVFVSTR